MTEKNEFDTAISDANVEIAQEDITDIIPQNTSDEILIPVKFNKEIKNLSINEASQLAQTGMKSDALKEELDTLKMLANKNGKSIAEFLRVIKETQYQQRREELATKCGGDFSFAEHILSLEENDNQYDALGFEELKKEFPHFKALEELPEEVLENARLKGRLLLDEYLRFRLAEKKRIQLATKTQKTAENTTLGSQINRDGAVNPETLEFLRGLWK